MQASHNDDGSRTSLRSGASLTSHALCSLEDGFRNPLIRATAILDELARAAPTPQQPALEDAAREIRDAMNRLQSTVVHEALVAGAYTPTPELVHLSEIVDKDDADVDLTIAGSDDDMMEEDTHSWTEGTVEVDPAPIRVAVTAACRDLHMLGIGWCPRLALTLAHSTLTIDVVADSLSCDAEDLSEVLESGTRCALAPACGVRRRGRWWRRKG